MEADDPVTVYTVTNPYEADVIQMVLRGESISCELDGEGQAGLSDILAIGILVPARDADRALRIIEQSNVKRQGEASRLHAANHRHEE
jgi:hypothetical protein